MNYASFIINVTQLKFTQKMKMYLFIYIYHYKFFFSIQISNVFKLIAIHYDVLYLNFLKTTRNVKINRVYVKVNAI